MKAAPFALLLALALAVVAVEPLERVNIPMVRQDAVIWWSDVTTSMVSTCESVRCSACADGTEAVPLCLNGEAMCTCPSEPTVTTESVTVGDIVVYEFDSAFHWEIR